MGCCEPHTNGTSGDVVASLDVFQVDSEATLMSSSTSFVTLATLAGDAKVADGEEWKINMCVCICPPYAVAGLGVNAEQKWLIETAAGVFTEFDRYSVDGHIAIVGDEISMPSHRTKKLTASMDAPRMRIQVRRTVSGSSIFLWELPRWGGAQIEAA